MSHSVRLTFRLGKTGDQDIEAVADVGCRVHVEAKPGDDGEIVVEACVVWGELVHGEGEADQPIPCAGACQSISERHRHVVRIGNGEFGCVRVLSHDVSPYNWRLVNFAASQQSGLQDLSNAAIGQSINVAGLNSLNAKAPGVEA